MDVKEMAEEFLNCPKCHGNLKYKAIKEETEKEKEVLFCDVCGEYYPIKDGIPILLIDEAKKMIK